MSQESKLKKMLPTQLTQSYINRKSGFYSCFINFPFVIERGKLTLDSGKKPGWCYFLSATQVGEWHHNDYCILRTTSQSLPFQINDQTSSMWKSLFSLVYLLYCTNSPEIQTCHIPQEKQSSGIVRWPWFGPLTIPAQLFYRCGCPVNSQHLRTGQRLGA